METRDGASDPLLVGAARHWTTLRAALVAFALCLAPAAARADSPSPFRLRATVDAGYVLSRDQHRLYHLELPVLEGIVRVGWVVIEPLVLELGIGAGAYLASVGPPGGLLDATLGAELGVREGPARLWVGAHVGAGWTGPLVRPVLRLSIGADLDVTPEIALGPTFGYAHVFQDDGPRQSDDAQAISIGLTLTYRPREATPTPPPPPTVARRPPPSPRRAPPPPDPAPPPVPTEELMTMLDEAAGLAPTELLVPVLFDFDSTAIVACTVPSLYALRDHLAAHPEILVLEIEGHADGRGSDAYNDALSLRRAEAIRDWLVEHGVAPERLRVAARGEAAPLENADTDEAHLQNRRARFRVVEAR